MFTTTDMNIMLKWSKIQITSFNLSLILMKNPTCFRILPILKLSISALTLQSSILEPPINTLQVITSIVISEVLSPIVMSS